MRSRVLVVVLALALGSAGTAVASAQAATASLAGTVTSESGQPLAGVCVEVFGEQAFVTAETGADGRYGVTDLPPGEYAVAFNGCEAGLPGYVAEFYDDVEGLAEPPTPVVLTGGDVRTGIDAALMPGATISGRVTADADGRPLPGICVGAFSEQTGSFGQDETGDDGAYALTKLRGGDYQVVFSDCSAPFTYLGEIYDNLPLDGAVVIGPGVATTEVTVVDRGQVTGIDAGLAEGGSVAGTVTALHTGKPVDGVCVALLPVDGDDLVAPGGLGFTGVQPDGTPAPGEFVVPSVRPGEYVLGFNPSQICGDDGYTVQWHDGASGPEDADPLVVGVGDVLAGFDAVLAPRPSISAACSVFGEPAGPPSFSDVPDGNLHAPAIDCIAERGVTSGRGDGTFGPVERVRRDQLASFTARTLAALGVELPRRPRNAFRDDDASVHELAIDQLAQLGIVSGTGEGRFDPLGTVTRGQMATFLVRAYETATGNQLRTVRDVFTDDESYLHERNINRAAIAGLAVGRTTTTYQPLDSVNREQMATFLARLLDRAQRDTVFDPTGPGVPVPAPAGSIPAQLAAFGLTSAAKAALLSARSR